MMNGSETRFLSGRPETNPLLAALVLSLVIHLGLYGTWRLGQQLGWWTHNATWLVEWTRRLTQAKPSALSKLARKKEQTQERVIPLTFVEVDPETATTEPPKDAKYYSSQNSKAQNPDAKVDTEIPKADGKQDQVVRLKDIEKPKPFPLQPSPPKPDELTAPKPKGGEQPGDLALVKPRSDSVADTSPGESLAPPRERPRTLAAARAQKGLVGQKMKQDGGTSSRGKLSFDAKATAFGDYDRAFIEAVQQRWYDLIEEHQGTQRSGKVVLDFRLNSDGRITDLKVQGNDVGEILGMMCQRAILDPQPYQKWPEAMRREIGSNTREVRFTFYYN